tara:strand:- start:9 stop:152 length:144 start_codon:yes stop_codon:yes gene_type:complete
MAKGKLTPEEKATAKKTKKTAKDKEKLRKKGIGMHKKYKRGVKRRAK